MSDGAVSGVRAGAPRPISSVDDSGTERLAVDAAVSGVAEINLDAADDEVAVYGEVDGDGAVHVVNVDSAGRVRTDSTLQVADADASVANPVPTRLSDGTDTALITAAGELSVRATAQAGTDIGDVTVNNAAGASAVNVQDGGNSLTVDNATLSVLGGGTEATAQRVTIASDSTGVVSIDDNGGSLTVDGTVEIGATSLAALETIELGTTTLSALESITVQNGAGASAVNVQDGGNALTVDATDLDIRNLTATDVVTAEQATHDSLNANANLQIANADVSATNPVNVQGNQADGAAVAGNPVLIAGVNAGNAQTIETSSSGEPFVTSRVAHDDADSGGPHKIGAQAIAHGANPSAVAAADRTNLYANRHGVLFTIGGHPNVVSWEYNTTAAQTNDNILAAIGAGTKYVITGIECALDEATTVGVGFRIGFGTASVPAEGASGADAVVGVVASHPGIVPGDLYRKGDGSGIIGIGGDAEELRITSGVPTNGKLTVTVTGYTCES